MKECSKCHEIKSMDDFYRLNSKKDGRRPDCKDCNKKTKRKRKEANPIMHRCEKLGYGVIQRTVTEVDKVANRCYKENGIVSEIGSTGIEIAHYLYDNFYVEIKSLIDEGKLPSLDRIDSKENYKEGNIQIVDFKENYLDGLANAVKKTSKKVRVVSPDKTEKVYESVSEAARVLGKKRDTIINNRDKGTTTKDGYQFFDMR